MRAILITGASGMLGSALLVECCKRYSDAHIIASDMRSPNPALKTATDGATWIIGDLTDATIMDACFAQFEGFSETYVYHFAAYYDFESAWSDVYQEHNLNVTKRICELCLQAGVMRLIFASTVGAYAHDDLDQIIDERSHANSPMPYGKSKRLCEKILHDFTELNHCILRIGAVFTVHCELPPLYGLLKIWGAAWPLNRMILGKGKTAMPYIHRRDFVALAIACMERDNALKPHELFLACGSRSVNHQELFQRLPGGRKPIHFPVWFARIGLGIQRLLGSCFGKMPIERQWMFKFTDRTFNIDNTYTRSQLDWDCDPERDILKKLPELCAQMESDRQVWRMRNELRFGRQYDWVDC